MLLASVSAYMPTHLALDHKRAFLSIQLPLTPMERWGGLVDLGKPENLGRLLEQALNRSKICSSDPLCSEHDPEKDRSLHGSSCHACSLVAETSCEPGNRYLDRSLLIPTLERGDAAFFKGF